MPSVQPVAPHLRVGANKLVFLQVLQGRPQVITDTGRKYQREPFFKLMLRELALHKGALKDSDRQVSGTVPDPQLAPHRRRPVSPAVHEHTLRRP
jgi:hypothetical protein